MGITIKMRQEKWRLSISDEEWEFDKRADLEKAIKTILDFKEKKGKIK